MQKLSNKFESLIKYGVAAILLAVPLYPKFPFIRIPGTYVSIRLEDFVVLVVSIIWFFAILPNFKKLVKNKIAVAIFIFWLVGLLSILSAIFLTHTAPLHIAILHWGRRVQYMITFFIGLYSLKNKQNLAFYIKCLMIVVVIAFFYGAAQKYFNLPIITTQNQEYSKGVALRYTPEGGHLVSTFAGHYDMATFLILVSPLLVVLLFNKKVLTQLNISSSGFLSRIIIAVTLLSGLWLLVFSASRISIVSYVGAIVLALLLIKKYWAIPLVFVVVLLFSSFSGNLVARYMRVFEVVSRKVLSVSNYINKPVFAADETVKAEPTAVPQPVLEDRSSSIRFNVEWPRAIRALTKNPLLGTGYSSITLATDNDYLRLLGEVGILGFMAFSAILFRLVTSMIKYLFAHKPEDLEDMYVVGVFSALPGILLNAVFIDIFEASKFAIVFWIVIGICVKLMEGKKDYV